MDTCHNVDESPKYYTEWNKPDKKIHGFYLYEIQEKVKQVYEYSDRKLSSGFLRLETEGIG